MGNEISTVGGAIATAGTAIAYGITFGQVDAIGDALESCAEFTAEKAQNTLVRHAGEAVVHTAATVGVAVAAGVTLGQVNTLNELTVECFERTTNSLERTGMETIQILDGVTDGTPGIAHIKGGIMYALNETERGDRAMKNGSRSIGVIAGGIGGFAVGGPVGAYFGGVSGGLVMDGVTTGVESAIHGSFMPNGTIASWDNVVNAKTSQDRIEGLVGVVSTPVLDGVAGLAAGKSIDRIQKSKAPPSYESVVSEKPSSFQRLDSKFMASDSSLPVSIGPSGEVIVGRLENGISVVDKLPVNKTTANLRTFGSLRTNLPTQIQDDSSNQNHENDSTLHSNPYLFVDSTNLRETTRRDYKSTTSNETETEDSDDDDEDKTGPFICFIGERTPMDIIRSLNLTEANRLSNFDESTLREAFRNAKRYAEDAKTTVEAVINDIQNGSMQDDDEEFIAVKQWFLSEDEVNVGAHNASALLEDVYNRFLRIANLGEIVCLESDEIVENMVVFAYRAVDMEASEPLGGTELDSKIFLYNRFFAIGEDGIDRTITEHMRDCKQFGVEFEYTTLSSAPLTVLHELLHTHVVMQHLALWDTWGPGEEEIYSLFEMQQPQFRFKRGNPENYSAFAHHVDVLIKYVLF